MTAAEYLAKVKADPRRAAALERARERWNLMVLKQASLAASAERNAGKPKNFFPKLTPEELAEVKVKWPKL